MMKTSILIALAGGASALTCDQTDPECAGGCLAQNGNNDPTCKHEWGKTKCAKKNGKKQWITEWCDEEPDERDLCVQRPDCTGGCVARKMGSGNGLGKLRCKRDWTPLECIDAAGVNWNQWWFGGAVKWAETKYCFPTPSTTAEKTKCLAAKDDWEGLYESHGLGGFCDVCCPSCTAVLGYDSFQNAFEPIGGSYSPWRPKGDIEGCLCLELEDMSDWWHEPSDANKGLILLTEFADCLRATDMSTTSVYGGRGDDAMYMNGATTMLYGNHGNDNLMMDGVNGNIEGEGGDDVCTDLGENKFHNEWGSIPYRDCETCFGPDDRPFDCETGNPPLPQILECFQRDDIATGEYCGTCCPACTAVVGTDSFKSNFAKSYGPCTGQAWCQHYTSYFGWWPTGIPAGRCVCLDLEGVSGYENDDKISLSSSSWSGGDCVRITGNDNHVIGWGGNDAMFANGVGNLLDGVDGADHLAMDGTGGTLWGGAGDNDACTDLSGGLNSFSTYSCDGNCYDGSGDAIACGD